MLAVGDAARRTLEAGNDPLAERKHDKLVAAFKAANTVGDIAREYIDKMVAEGRAGTTTSKANWLLEQLEPIAVQPAVDLKPLDVLAALKRIEAKGKHETARRCRSFAGRIFRYAVATGRGEADPTSLLVVGTAGELLIRLLVQQIFTCFLRLPNWFLATP